MPKQNPDAEAALKKLGHHLRLGWAKKHPVQDKDLESVRDTVREQWEKEQVAERPSKPTPSPTKDRKPKPPEPDRE
ncbi:MAG: hypothetical protein ACLQU4_16840 [Limisphaerales bacterium]